MTAPRDVPEFRSRPLRDPFADRASLLCRVLLEHPGQQWSVRGLAEAASVAPMLSSDVVRQLESARLLTTRPDGRKLLCRLTDPQGLLDAWTASYRWDRNAAITVASPVVDEARLLRRLQTALVSRRWALTLLAGAWRRMRYTPTDVLHVYVACETIAELRALAAENGWPPDPAGRLILMKPAYRTSVWFGASSDDLDASERIPIVSDLQLTLDLWHYPERGRETALQLWRPIVRRFERAATEQKAADP